ncbi:MAG: ABC transporter permease [Alphaproteobacteria bacterium]|nr:ABC transporter permease [Alphaproteobacteria bacterium]
MSTSAAARGAAKPRTSRTPAISTRFAAIWVALAILMAVSAVVAPRSVLPGTLLEIAPLAAFLAIVSCGQALVLMSGGIDLSPPALITLASTLLLGISRGHGGQLPLAMALALLACAAVGLLNGILIAVLRVNALIATLADGAIVSGLTLWYREGLPAEARVPAIMATWGDLRLFGLNMVVWIAAALIALLAVLLRKTVTGRRFAAVGANPRAAWIAGLNVQLFQSAAYTLAALLYGLVGLLLSAFIRNPTLKVGDPYLLAPIAAAVLGGTAIGGGIGSMVAVAGAALFLTQLGQLLVMLGLPTAYQFIINGAVIAVGMALGEGRLRVALRPARPDANSP